MEILTPFERKILKTFRKSAVDISDITERYGKETTEAVRKLYEMKLIDGEFSYINGNFSAEIPVGEWQITPHGRLYLRNSKSVRIQNIKDKIIDNIISFIFGLISGLITGIRVGYIIFANHWL